MSALRHRPFLKEYTYEEINGEFVIYNPKNEPMGVFKTEGQAVDFICNL